MCKVPTAAYSKVPMKSFFFKFKVLFTLAFSHFKVLLSKKISGYFKKHLLSQKIENNLS